MDGWIDVKAILRIDSIVKMGAGEDGWMGGKAILRVESIVKIVLTYRKKNKITKNMVH